MAEESKFLKYQDTNGDKLIDVCEEVVEVAEAPKCPECIPNPYAAIANWKEKTVDEPFFNQKECLYHITVVTEYTDTMDSSLLENEDITEEEAAAGTNARFDEYVNEALESLLVNNDKDSSAGSILKLRETVEYTSFDLDARPNSRLKLLYSVPFDSLWPIDDADNEEEDEEDDASEFSGVTVTYETDELRTNLNKVKRGLQLYNRYLLVHRAVDGGNILKVKDNSVFNLETYGDSRIFKNSTLGSILIEIDSFLNARKMNIVGVGSPALFQDRVTKIDFTFNENYKLVKMLVYTAGCGDRPKIFKEKKLKSLNAKSSFKDPTAMAYFTKIDDMLIDLEAREPMGWIDFITTHTYPEVYDTFDTNRADAPTTSCIAGRLQDEAKQLGQDILDQAFSIGDAVAYAFKKQNCLNELDELEEQDRELGLIAAPDATTQLVPMDSEKRKNTPYDKRRQISMVNRKRMVMMAKEQAFKTLEDDDIVFTKWCASLLGVDQTQAQESKSGAFNIEDAVKKFEELKLCGLFDLLKEAISCLLGGLTLEQAMAKIAESALKAMSVENFSDLFVGLPEDVRADLGGKAMTKLAKGDVFQDQKTNQEISDSIAKGGPINSSGLDIEDSSSIDTASDTEKTRRTLAQTFDGSTTNELNQDVLIQAYIAALIEHYSDDMLALIDKLQKYPGAQMIAKTLAFFDCPQDPIMDPGIFDFIKSIELPMCRNGKEIVMPKLANPFGWIPEVKDWWGILFQLLKNAIQQLIISIILKLFVKICSVISGALCKALETAGSLVASIPSGTTGRSNFKDTIREKICGDNANEDEIDDTIADLFDSLGSGAAALSDQEQLNNFVGDISSSVTQGELYDAMLGDASFQFLEIVDSLIEYEYQTFRESFPNKESIGNFFKNIGNLMPADAKAAMEDAAGDPNMGTGVPANPSLCYTEDQWDEFCELRASLLSGRAAPSQIADMCNNMRDGMADDLGDLSDALQSGFGPGGFGDYIGDQMPPLTGDPGCDNGLVPFESEEAASAASFALSNDFEKLKVAFSIDMLGNGPGEKNWGLVNMILSDTMGMPLTAHYRKSFNRRAYVDFASDTGDLDLEEIITGRVALTRRQRGAFPAYVAEWLQYQLEGSNEANDLKENLNFSSNNEWQSQTVSTATFESLGIENKTPLALTATLPLAGAIVQTIQSKRHPDFKYYELPSQGYNVKAKVDIESESVKFVTRGRKSNPDATLSFKDNAKGLRSGLNSKDSAYGYGFKVQLFFSDLEKALPAYGINPLGKRDIGVDTKSKVVRNIYSDNVRVLITEDINPGAKWELPQGALLFGNLPAVGDDDDTTLAYSDRRYEFLAEDATLSEFDLSSYTSFNESFSTQKSYIPQVTLLHEILQNNGGVYLEQEVKDFHDEFMNTMFETFLEKVANNTAAFNYGAEYDTLSREDADYVIPYNTPNVSSEYWGGPYGEALIEDEELDDDGNVTGTFTRGITNNDMILGVSKMQYQIDHEDRNENNRVFYLDPVKFGGNYMSPPVFIKPLENKGWLGFVDVLFPELGPCKPQRTDLVDFDEIQDVVDEAYRNMPEDERLREGDSDCVEELPYNRILERSDAAGIEGLITAAIRIYVTAHMVKSLATFSVFKPSFPDVYSDMYAQYIVEAMQESFSEADPDISDRLGIYSQEEFWFGFLEQAVQMYARKVDSGEIINPPAPVLDALFRLNDMQEDYSYPSKRDLKEAKDLGEIRKIKTLKNYREERNYNAIYKTQDLSKKILKELVVEQLNYMGDTLLGNLASIDIKPEIDDMLYYILNNMTQGASLELYPPFVEESEEIPVIPYLENSEADGPYYTGGGEFSVYEIRAEDTSYSKGDEYVGYYHVHIDEDGNLSYMEGPDHIEEAHNLLKPFATKVIVPIGEVADYGFTHENDNSKPFLIEKYVSINNVKYSASEASAAILNNTDLTKNIADVYPGTLEHVLGFEGDVVGLTGELGVRYGLQFSMIIDGVKTSVTSVEIDALDLPLSQFVPLENNSKNLLCLIHMLKKDTIFNVITRYILPFNKIISAIAIYNDMSFLPSIGEVTVADDSTYGKDSEFESKPGMRVVTEEVEDDDGNEYTEIVEVSSNAGWSSLADRNPGPFAGLFVNEWDSWDHEILRKSKKRIKKMFRTYYKHSWELKAGNLGDLPRPGAIMLKDLRSRMSPSPGKGLLPWWKRRRLRTNPFDSKGNICEKE